MFYQTTVKSVGSGGVIDVQGRFLTFIGDLPVNEGDTVFTDGKVIFGHAPPKGSPAVFDQPSGIPVSGDEDSSGENELRGYFTTGGKYKKYSVKGDEWIVNNKKKFAHEDADTANLEFNERKIIDVAFSDDGDEFITVDGFFKESQCVKYKNHLYVCHHNDVEALHGEMQYSINFYTEAFEGEEITLGFDKEKFPVNSDKNVPVAIFKNRKLYTEISLEEYADYVVQLMARQEDRIRFSEDNTGADFIKQPPPPDDFIASKYARVVAFNVDESGEWSAIISAAAYGYIFLFCSTDASVFESIFNKENGSSKSFSEQLARCLDDLEDAIFTKNYYPWLEIEKYEEFTGIKTDTSGYTAEYKKYIEDKLEYYIPLVRFKSRQWFPVVYGGSALLCVKSDGSITEIRTATWGGHYLCVEAVWDEENTTWNYWHSANSFPNFSGEDCRFEMGDGNTLLIRGRELQGFYRTGQNENFLTLETDSTKLKTGKIGFNYCDVDEPLAIKQEIDSTAAELAARLGANTVSSIWHRAIYTPLPHSYWLVDFPIYGGSHEWDYSILGIGHHYLDESEPVFAEEYEHIQNSYTHTETSHEYDWLEGIFDENSDDGFFRFKPCFTALKNGYLFGIQGDKLILKTNDGVELVGDGLKNFRLRELKKISKAKK